MDVARSFICLQVANSMLTFRTEMVRVTRNKCRSGTGYRNTAAANKINLSGANTEQSLWLSCSAMDDGAAVRVALVHNQPASCRVQLKCDGTRWGREGKWRGNWPMEWVASTLHTTSEHGVSSITTADAHTSAASSRLNWRPPADLNGLVSFAERRNLVSERAPSHFKRGTQTEEVGIRRLRCEFDNLHSYGVEV